MDPHFTTHLAIAQVWGSTAFLLAETPLLPIDCSDYATALNKGVLDIERKYGSALAKKGISLGKLNCDLLNDFKFIKVYPINRRNVSCRAVTTVLSKYLMKISRPLVCNKILFQNT